MIEMLARLTFKSVENVIGKPWLICCSTGLQLTLYNQLKLPLHEATKFFTQIQNPREKKKKIRHIFKKQKITYNKQWHAACTYTKYCFLRHSRR
jgi:hypothetical protein